MHAHESQCKYSDLGMLDRDKSIQHTWKNVFIANKLGSERDLNGRAIAIRFIFDREMVVCVFYFI